MALILAWDNEKQLRQGFQKFQADKQACLCFCRDWGGLFGRGWLVSRERHNRSDSPTRVFFVLESLHVYTPRNALPIIPAASRMCIRRVFHCLRHVLLAHTPFCLRTLARFEKKETHTLLIYTQTNSHTHTHSHQDQCEWHRMTRMTGPDCVVMCNLINTHTHTHTHTHTWHRMTRMTRPDCAVMCNLINTHTHTPVRRFRDNSC